MSEVVTTRVERNARIGFLLALAVLVTAGLMAYRTTEELIHAAGQVAQTESAIGALAAVAASITEAESSERGYLLTGNESYVKRYDGAVADVSRSMSEAGQLLSDTPAQRQRLDDLKELAQQRTAALATGIEMRRREGFDAARHSIIVGTGAQIMQQVRDKISALDKEEQDLLELRASRSRRSRRDVIILFVASAASQILLLTAVYRLFVNDIKRRRAAQSELSLYATQLHRSNRELEDFASVASHDLQEPLRKIQAFGDRLRARAGPSLGPDADDYLRRMQNAAARMQTLINDLLTFSRISTRALPFAQVDLGLITREVLSDLEVRIEQLGATVEVGALPTISADPLQMRQLMQNLIGNALKFHRANVSPRISIECKILGNEPSLPGARPAVETTMCQISVQDNGIGFETKYLDRIFTVFQRLHARAEYEGTGVGLAVCRKIVERHGGSITAESEPDQGSRFVVTIPIQQPQSAMPATPSSIMTVVTG